MREDEAQPKVEFGSVEIRDFALSNGETNVLLFVTGCFSAAHDKLGGRIGVTLDQAADIFAALAEYLPIRKDEGEEAEVESILAAVGAANTPD